MSKFMELCMGVAPVEEGWGTALARVAKVTGYVATGVGSNMVTKAAVAGNISKVISGTKVAVGGLGGFYGGLALGKVIGTISNMSLSKLLKDPKLSKYLNDQCSKILKEEQRKDKSVTASLPSDPGTLIKRWWHNNDEVGFFSKPNFLMQHNDWIDDQFFNLKVGPYTCTFWYDTENISAAVLLLYSADRDKCIGRRIPAPTNDELKRMFHE